MQKHIQPNKDEQTHVFRKIYLSLYWKGCMWEGVGDRTKTVTYWPPTSSSGHSSASFLFSWAVQPGAWGPSLSAESWFPPLDLEHWLPALNSDFLFHSGYIIVLRPLNSTRRQSRLSPDLFDWMHLLFTQVHFSFDSLAGSEVNM